MGFIRISILFFLLLLAGCEEESSKNRRSFSSVSDGGPTLRLLVPENRNEYTWGEEILLTVSPSDTTIGITSVRILANNQLLVEDNGENTTYRIKTEDTGGGEIQLRAEVTFEDGAVSRRTKALMVKSDILPEEWSFEVVKRYPHDKESFTQGLLFHNNILYESTGNYGASYIRKINFETGEVLAQADLDNKYFGEGITITNNKIYQLTYKDSKGFIYDAETLQLTGEFNYTTQTSEGWGITHNDTSLILSDGSANLYFIHPDNFAETRRLKVFDDQGEITDLNELELIGDTIFANLYTSATIVKIDPSTGRVYGYLNLRGVVKREEVTGNIDVLNGIAVNPKTNRLVVTGKYWPLLYEITQKKVPAVN